MLGKNTNQKTTTESLLEHFSISLGGYIIMAGNTQPIGDLRWHTIDTIDLLGVHTDHSVDMADLSAHHIEDMVTVGQVLTEDIIQGEISADGKS